MSTNSSLKKELINKEQNTPGVSTNMIKSLINSDEVKKRFTEVLKERAPQYISSIINLVNSDLNLVKCDAMSVIASCMVAATLDLPVDRNLGYTWIVPYKNKASFQLGYKGYIQLALRSAQYKAMNVVEICEGELIKWNKLTEELIVDFNSRLSNSIIGYAGYFELVNGFRKVVYWTSEEIEQHRLKHSKSSYGWDNFYDSMAKKTVLRNMLTKWGILSIEMQMAFKEDISYEIG